ncbi:HNH endonuclease [Pseudomonas congelans]|nr:HNH endonuclease [Pseudomonas congelans]
MYKADGKSNYFYNTLRQASPGDLVISYANSQIRYVGLVTNFASPAPKPPSFRQAGENWDKKNGWVLPVEWRALKTPVFPKQYIEVLRDTLPKKYSPISPVTGKGHQGVYLTEVGEQVFNVLKVGFVSEPIAVFFDENRKDKVLDDIDFAIEKNILVDQSLSETVKQATISARRGQGLFRKRVSEFEKSCRLTGVDTPELLIASHIKPWRVCETAEQRLDGANGLLLTPNADLLFDRGLISFGDDGDVLISNLIKELDLRKLGVEQACLQKVGGFHDRQKIYLEYHRKRVFIGGV